MTRIVLILLLLIPASACGPGSGSSPNIVLITVDTLRADYLGSYGFAGDISPNLDALAAESVVFLNAFAQSPWTKPSVASMFTSLYAQTHGLTNHEGKYWGGPSAEQKTGILADEAVTLAERLRDAGYRTAAFVSNPWLLEAYGFAQGFEHYDEDHVGLAVPADRLTQRAQAWLESVPAGRPYFVYLHFMDVHAPYAYYSPKSDYDAMAGGESFGPDRTLNERDVPYNRWQNIEKQPKWATDEMRHTLSYWKARYASGIRSFDRRVGPFIDFLRQSGRLDSAYLMVTSDHGEELFEHGDWSHGWQLFGQQLWVPLFVRAPRARGGGRKVESVVELVDVMPTLLSLAGAEPSLTAQGRDVSALLLEGGSVEQHQAFATATSRDPGLYSLRDDRHKLIYNVSSEESWLYDVRTDPTEQDNRAAGERELLARLKDDLLEHIADSLADGALDPELTTIPEDLQERLRSLGYLN